MSADYAQSITDGAIGDPAPAVMGNTTLTVMVTKRGGVIVHVFPRFAAQAPTPASRDRFAALPPGVVTFRVHIRTEQSMFKLSQDIGAERYTRVGGAFAAENPRLADLMDG